jgi:hypothetical protein
MILFKFDSPKPPKFVIYIYESSVTREKSCKIRMMMDNISLSTTLDATTPSLIANLMQDEFLRRYPEWQATLADNVLMIDLRQVQTT